MGGYTEFDSGSLGRPSAATTLVSGRSEGSNARALPEPCAKSMAPPGILDNMVVAEGTVVCTLQPARSAPILPVVSP